MVYSVGYHFFLHPKPSVFVRLGNVVGKVLQETEVNLEIDGRYFESCIYFCNTNFHFLQDPCLMKWQNG